MNTSIIAPTLEEFKKKHEEIKSKLTAIILPEDKETHICNGIGYTLEVSPQTIKNYWKGKISDGFLAEAIYKEFKRLKLTK